MPGARRGDGFALEVSDLCDAGLHHHAISAIVLVELEDLRGGNPSCIPADPGFHSGRCALHIARRDGEVTIFCGIFLIVTSRPCFEQPGLLGQCVSGAKPVQPEMPMATLAS